ncbi:hypothetical protein OEZ85_010135 [Tetradesmus obliquus]|uniref:START domain-containing protein n=1 Tax=Tetradesmus obliquus TaxID=3088 RepID=A0ABY8TNL2_TETOB|nr:hypothetical protein OEZ85_010135 [Tetradesmus obliquus]
MAKLTKRGTVFGFRCCGQAQVKHEEDGAPFAGLINSSSVSADAPDPTLSNAAVMGKVAASGSRTTNITVRTFTDSSGGSSCLGAIEEQQEQQLLLSSAGSSGLQDNAGGCEEWYDCAEDWQDDDTTAAAAEAAAASEKAQQQAAEELLSALPAELAHILRRYTQGRSLGCKPAVALMQYMEASGTSLEQLQQLLQPLLEAEQQQGAADLPVPTPVMDPLARTAALVDAAAQSRQQGGHANSSSSELQHVRPSLSRLLGNVKLCVDTLAGMAREEGFKQVAWGALELWYCHDTLHHRQIIRGRVVLDEPVEHAVCLARELDLATSWNPAITEMMELAAYSPSELLLYLLLWTPWPLPQPEVVNYAVGLDLLDSREEAVLIATHGCSGELPAGVVLPQHARGQRLTMDAGGFKFMPLPPHPARPGVPRMEVTVLVSIDASRWVVPDALISFVLKVFAPLVLKSVLKVLQRMFHSSSSSKGGAGSPAGAACSGSALTQRLAARPEYAAVGAHARRYLVAKAAAQAGSAAQE